MAAAAGAAGGAALAAAAAGSCPPASCLAEGAHPMSVAEMLEGEKHMAGLRHLLEVAGPPDVMERLSDCAFNGTVFAPDDAGVALVLAELGYLDIRSYAGDYVAGSLGAADEYLSVKGEARGAFGRILRYHVADGARAALTEGERVATLLVGGAPLEAEVGPERGLWGRLLPGLQAEHLRAAGNRARVKGTAAACNAVVHVVDHLLLPEPVSALERPDRCYFGEFSAGDVMDGTPEFSLFAAMLERAPRLSALARDPMADATWFVPTNEGLEAAVAARGTTVAALFEDAGRLDEVLAGHVVMQALPALRSLNNATAFTSLGGGELTLVQSGRSFRFAADFPFFDLGGAPEVRGPSGSAKVGQPRGACKAIVYPLDKLLWP